MSITWADLVVWVVVGVLAGSLAATVVTGKWAGLGRWSSLGVGLVGALIGGLIFTLFSEYGQALMRLPSRFGIS
jgi:uncharacterized membrane protein YeaQ/YmgE (transglycosylase-associated protein family)